MMSFNSSYINTEQTKYDVLGTIIVIAISHNCNVILAFIKSKRRKILGYKSCDIGL